MIEEIVWKWKFGERISKLYNFFNPCEYLALFQNPLGELKILHIECTPTEWQMMKTRSSIISDDGEVLKVLNIDPKGFFSTRIIKGGSSNDQVRFDNVMIEIKRYIRRWRLEYLLG